MNTKRNGATLTEVLIAIFCMAIGMLSLLALFPIGIQNTGRSVRNNRVAAAAANAESIAELHNVRTDSFIQTSMQNPAFTFFTGLTRNFPPDGSSPPVWIDPIGFETYGPPGLAVGRKMGLFTNFDNVGIPRSPVSFALPGTGLARRWFSQEDDITFDTFGEAGNPPRLPGQPLSNPPPVVDRERKYSWAYLWRRPRYSDPKVAELTVVVFSGRKLQQTATGLLSPTGEDLYTNTPPGANAATPVFRAGSSLATILAPGSTTPAIKAGDWVFDTTVKMPNAGDPRLMFNGYFYRVAEVSDPYTDSRNQRVVDLTLLSPARADGYVAVFMAGIVNVIEKGDGRMPAN